jgi:hypothetical protein
MSTVSFQDYVRERQRHDATAGQGSGAGACPAPAVFAPRRAPMQPAQFAREELAKDFAAAPLPPPWPRRRATPASTRP